MEIFEYVCNKCGNRFEFQHGQEDLPRCTKCSSKDVKQVDPNDMKDFDKPKQGGCSCCGGCNPK